MPDTPQITETADQLTAFIPLTVPRAEIQTVMGPSIREVHGRPRRPGDRPGRAVVHPPPAEARGDLRLRICVPVATPVAAAGRVKPGRLPAARVARTVYQRALRGAGAAWGEFFAWVEANGHAPRTDLWECYLVGPESGRDPADYGTELNRPLVG